ncbi:MAG: hypothetical protein HGA59_02955 [Chlorobiaceae bacterium]|nr:hypothetical protein [Chlorobiaceae bacterium]
MCNEEGTTKEHVPPKCLFPEAKDVEGDKNYKINLITVPSCEAHNTAKSKDDVYLLFFLAANIVSNDVSKQHFSTKIIRAVQRAPHVFAEFAKKNTPVMLKGEDGKVIHTAAIEIDRDRFESAITHIAHGIYYHKYNSSFPGEVIVFTEGLMDLGREDSVAFNEKVQGLGVMIDEYMKNTPLEGNNPDIFTFQLNQDSHSDQTVIRLNFYNDFKVTAILKNV